VNPSIFRKYDIRGVVSVDSSTEFAKERSLACAPLLKGIRPAADRKVLAQNKKYFKQSSID
jgi:phosphomannomutase